jgi:hypothetical protein
MAYFAIRLHEIHPQVTRSVRSDGGKGQDKDVVTFAVFVNQRERGRGASTFTPVFSGGRLRAGIFPPRTGDGISRAWRIGPMDVGPGDVVTIVYTCTNISDEDIEIDAERQAEIEIKVLNTVVFAVLGAPALGVIGAAVGGVLGAIGDPIGKLLGFSTTPKCNGLVFSDVVTFTGSGLASLPFAAPGLASIRLPRGATEAFVAKSYTDVATHDTGKCGPVAETDVTFSVAQLPSIDVRFWLNERYPGKNLRNGIRQLGPAGAPIGVRSLLRL